MNKAAVTLSICIPTYNRHDILITNIKSFIESLNELTEIIILDNSEKISSENYSFFLQQDKITYHINNENIGAVRNIIKVLSLAKGDYLLLMSDEDIPNLNVIYRLFSSITFDLQDLIFASQNIHMEDHNNLKYLFYPDNYYMSGIIFKRKSLESLNLDYELSRERFGYLGTYPHMYIVNTLLVVGKLLISSDKIYTKGEELGEVDLDNIFNEPYYHPFSRTIQFKEDLSFISYIEIDLKNRYFVVARLFKQFIESISAYRVWAVRNIVNDYNYHFVKTEKKYDLFQLYISPILTSFSEIKKLRTLTKFMVCKLFYHTVVQGLYFYLSSVYLLKGFHNLPTHGLISRLIRILNKL